MSTWVIRKPIDPSKVLSLCDAVIHAPPDHAPLVREKAIALRQDAEAALLTTHSQVARPTPGAGGFERQLRYFVLKLLDAKAALSPEELAQLDAIGAKVDAHRAAHGKQPLESVVIESDWPEFEPAWKAIEARVNAG